MPVRVSVNGQSGKPPAVPAAVLYARHADWFDASTNITLSVVCTLVLEVTFLIEDLTDFSVISKEVPESTVEALILFATTVAILAFDALTYVETFVAANEPDISTVPPDIFFILGL